MLYTSLLAHTLPELFSRFLCPQRPPESQQTPCGGGLVTRSCLTLVTPWTLTCQVPLPMGFSRQEYWSGLPFPAPGDLPTQESNPGLLHCRRILYQLNYERSLSNPLWYSLIGAISCTRQVPGAKIQHPAQFFLLLGGPSGCRCQVSPG